MKKDTWSRTRWFGGYIEITRSDLYRFHFRVGPVALYLESPELYAVIKKARRSRGSEEVKR